ncbi:MAG: hypothetical protein Q7V56_14190 [Gammaproteobacteria bacterium]|nr:hypothetical protein [Gammaproteobacteria bacterium]
MPAPDNLKTSVFRKSRMDSSEYQSIKEKVLTQRRKINSGCSIKVTAIVSLESIRQTGLQLNPEESEYRWHADIEGWPSHDDESKSKTKELAQLLAQAAALEQLSNA